jgi:hypothetical protein
LAALVVAGGAVLGVGVGATPAFAAGPPVPAGCTFDGGVLTCVTSAAAQTHLGPFDPVAPVTTVGGFTAAQICDLLNAPFSADTIHVVTGPGFLLTESVTTTTTTMRHGLHGKVFSTSSTAGNPTLVGIGQAPGGSTTIACNVNT